MIFIISCHCFVQSRIECFYHFGQKKKKEKRKKKEKKRIECHMYKCHVDTCFVQFIFQLLKYIFHFFLKMSLLDKNKIAPKKQVGFQKALLIKKGKKGAVWVKNNYFFVPVVHLTTISKHVTLSLSFWLGRLHCTTFSFSFSFSFGWW